MLVGDTPGLVPFVQRWFTYPMQGNPKDPRRAMRSRAAYYAVWLAAMASESAAGLTLRNGCSGFPASTGRRPWLRSSLSRHFDGAGIDCLEEGNLQQISAS